MALFLVWHEESEPFGEELSLGLDRFELRPGLCIVRSDESLSKLYHQVKWALPRATALLVAPLEAAPKMKLMHPGALRWLRQRDA